MPRFLLLATVTALLGAGWVFLSVVGTEWDYCRKGEGCIAGWKMGTGLIGVALTLATVGIRLLRRG